MALLKFEESNDGSMKLSGEMDLGERKQRFNPMQSWMQAGEVLDATTSLPNNRVDVGIGGTTPTAEQLRDLISPNSVYQTMNPTPTAHPSGVVPDQMYDFGSANMNSLYPDQEGVYKLPDAPMVNAPPVGGYYPGQIGIDPVSLAMTNMPYDATGGLPNAFEGTPPPPTAYGAPPLSGGIQESSANTPPPGYPSDAMTAPGYRTPGELPNTAPPGTPSVADFDSNIGAIENDWQATMAQGGASEAQVQQQDATIKTSAAQNNGTSTVGGAPAQDDPAMQRIWGELAYDPQRRKEEYTKKMNTIFMQAMLLDVAANAMGVPSRASAFMEQSMSLLEGQMKFDDQERLYRITQGVFYPNGVYDPPATQKEGFDRAMALGATAEEAAAISGYIPEGDVGFDTYYQTAPDGSRVNTIFVPKGQAPPPGATDQSGVAEYNASQLNPKAQNTPAALVIEQQVFEWNQEADRLEAAGDLEGAAILRQRAQNAIPRSNEYTYAQANTTFNSLYGSMMRAAAEYSPDYQNTMFDLDGNPIPWDTFRQQWLTSPEYSITVRNQDGTTRDVPTWAAMQGDTSPATPTADVSRTDEFVATPKGMGYTPKPSDIMQLREDPSPEAIREFVEAFGTDNLPEEFK